MSTELSGRIAIVAARNEGDSIAATLEALAEAMPGIRLIVADDASDDGTAEAAGQAGARVVSGEKVRGKGGNVSAAADTVRRQAMGATVLLCDADLGASAAELRKLVEAVEAGECDLAIAAFARRVGGGFGFAVGYAHRAIKKLCGFDAAAPISGQRAMRGELLPLLLPFADGFGMEIGITVDAVTAGYTAKEIELPLEHRATFKTLGGFAHRARQLRDFMRAYRARR